MGISIKTGPPRKDGRSALILQYYYGLESYRENLGKYLFVTPRNGDERDHNKSVMRYAEALRLKRLSEKENGVDVGSESAKGQMSFLQYFKKLMNEKRNVDGSYSTWRATYKHLMVFGKGQDIKFAECTDSFLNAFKKYLLTCKSMNRSIDLSRNSATIYFSKVKAALNQAISDKIIKTDPGKTVKNIKLDETFREFLSESEIRSLFTAECKDPILKRAFLFSCQTGLRWSDVIKLTWGDVRISEDEKRFKLHYKQKKTKSQQYHPISKSAVDLLGKVGDAEDEIFANLHYSTSNNKALANWIKKAGIDRHITFHCARHSYAIMMLIATKDIYLVSKLLGHKDIKTTLIYARIVNESANKAVDLFPDFSL